MASSTCRGFCEVAAESRYESGCPLNSCSKIGKSARRRCASSFGWALTAMASSYRAAVVPQEAHHERMPPLPTGTVTLLFTDVEGSTRLLDGLGADAYAGTLQEHRRRLRGAFGARGGAEVDTQGDAFFYAFAVASEAIAAAGEAQEALAEGPIRVRMGLHTGEPTPTEEGYVGPDVHRAARIAACGHGGQVLVSAATAALAQDAPLRDLGEHRLKDLSAPERIFQLGDGEF